MKSTGQALVKIIESHDMLHTELYHSVIFLFSDSVFQKLQAVIHYGVNYLKRIRIKEGI